jgi:hypothetical protein
MLIMLNVRASNTNSVYSFESLEINFCDNKSLHDLYSSLTIVRVKKSEEWDVRGM